jgi:hypothetical protein
MNPVPWMEITLQAGQRFVVYEISTFIAAGSITALLEPLAPITPRRV